MLNEVDLSVLLVNVVVVGVSVFVVMLLGVVRVLICGMWVRVVIGLVRYVFWVVVVVIKVVCCC